MSCFAIISNVPGHREGCASGQGLRRALAMRSRLAQDRASNVAVWPVRRGAIDRVIRVDGVRGKNRAGLGRQRNALRGESSSLSPEASARKPGRNIPGEGRFHREAVWGTAAREKVGTGQTRRTKAQPARFLQRAYAPPHGSERAEGRTAVLGLLGLPGLPGHTAGKICRGHD